MSQNKAIEIFLRVRPTKKPYQHQSIDDNDKKYDIYIPKEKESGYVNNTKERYSFQFNDVLGPETSQATVFNRIGKQVCDSALEGFNGTIFAYGQTGSGKTFSMTGGERYEDRGLIPRTLSYLFSEQQKRTDTYFNMSVSYIEIYAGTGYDLLDEKHNNTKLEDLPKVIPRETQDEDIILSGLSINKVEKEEDALNLLFIGDNHRVVCETPKNDASTRSHCIFIIMIESRKTNSDVKTYSRIHLVDLSGSERIKETGVEGKLAREAIGINLSLSALEHVIVCLNKKARGENIHIPYRNSLMTTVLRNSLGGNCKTHMIATVSPAEIDLDESISTCKFATRVALIKNTVEINQSLDPAVIISRLKKENEQLKAELALVKGENVRDCLDPEEIDKCKQLVKEFLANRDPSATIILNDRLKINECFYHFKHLFHEIAKKGGGMNILAEKEGGKGLKDSQEIQNKNNKINSNNQNQENNIAQFDEIKRLKLLVQQRDNEIMILLNLINKNKSQQQEMSVPANSQQQQETQGAVSNNFTENQLKESQPIIFKEQQDFQRFKQKQESINSMPSSNDNNQQSTRLGSDLSQVTLPNKGQDNQDGSQILNTSQKQINNSQQQQNDVQKMLLFPLNLSNEQLMDRANCFELFRKSYRKNEVMQENKEILKQKYNTARQLGAIVTNARNKIKILKNQIEDLRKEQALDVLSDKTKDSTHPEESKLIQEIEKLKRVYKENFDQLKELKQEIERIQLILEKSKEKLQNDFQRWLEVMMNQKQQMIGGGNQNQQKILQSQGSSISSNPMNSQQQYSHSQQNSITNNQMLNSTNSISTNVTVMKTIKQNNFMMENQLQKSNNTMQQSNVSKNMDKEISQVQDKDIKQNLEAFYKARDKIYQSNNNN